MRQNWFDFGEDALGVPGFFLKMDAMKAYKWFDIIEDFGEVPPL